MGVLFPQDSLTGMESGLEAGVATIGVLTSQSAAAMQVLVVHAHRNNKKQMNDYQGVPFNESLSKA